MRPLLTLLAAVLTAATAVPEARHPIASRCAFPPGPHGRSADATVLLGTATADTVLAGPGEISPSPHGGHSGSGAPGPIYGQVVEVARFGGADTTLLGPTLRERPNMRAVVVPWDYDPGCEPARWTTGFAWLEVGTEGTFAVQLRPDSLWIDGLPVFDAFYAAEFEPYPAAYQGRRSAPPESRAAPWLTPEEYFELLIDVPPYEEWSERPDSTWAVVLHWQAENPELAERYPATAIAHRAASSVAWEKARRVVRAIAPPVAGTYRMSLSLDDAPGRAFYVRTRSHPNSEWRPSSDRRQPADPLDEPERPTAYSMIAATALSMAELPIDCGDTRDISREGYVYVIDPPLDSGGRRDEWQGWLEVSLVTRPFQDDAVLDRFRQQAFDEWGARWRTRTELEAPARFWFDGDVLRVDQTTRLRDGSTLVVLGERISESTIECDW
jgi:hypothetical protein